MKNRLGKKLRAGRKLVLATAALIALGAPIVIGTLNVAPLLRAGGRVVNLSSAGHRCDTKEDS